MAVMPDAKALEEAARAAAGSSLPPVEAWDPPFRGDMDMVILADGRWIHDGSEIRRPRLVRLFSTILKREGERYFLVTPAEKVGIRVEDAPFLAVDVTRTDDALCFLTNVGDRVKADADHPIRVEDAGGEPAPYVTVRRNLEARIDRKSFYRVMEMGEVSRHDGADWFGIRSAGAFFPVALAEDLPD